jgi:hypothetical protein
MEACVLVCNVQFAFECDLQRITQGIIKTAMAGSLVLLLIAPGLATVA